MGTARPTGAAVQTHRTTVTVPLERIRRGFTREISDAARAGLGIADADVITLPFRAFPYS